MNITPGSDSETVKNFEIFSSINLDSGRGTRRTAAKACCSVRSKVTLGFSEMLNMNLITVSLVFACKLLYFSFVKSCSASISTANCKYGHRYL